MKEPNRNTQIHQKLELLTTYLEYFCEKQTFYKEVLPIIDDIEDYIRELSIDKKTYGIRIAKKFKGMYERELKELQDGKKEN